MTFSSREDWTPITMKYTTGKYPGNPFEIFEIKIGTTQDWVLVEYYFQIFLPLWFRWTPFTNLATSFARNLQFPNGLLLQKQDFQSFPVTSNLIMFNIRIICNLSAKLLFSFELSAYLIYCTSRIPEFSTIFPSWKKLVLRSNFLSSSVLGDKSETLTVSELP